MVFNVLYMLKVQNRSCELVNSKQLASWTLVVLNR